MTPQLASGHTGHHTGATQLLYPLPWWQLDTGLEDWDKAASIPPYAVLCPWTGCHAPMPYSTVSGPLVSPYSCGYPAVTPQHHFLWCHHAP